MYKMISASMVFVALLPEGAAKGRALTGTTNLKAAEVHIILRSHGEPIPGQIEAQTSTFSGGCRQNGCVNQHYSIHLPASE